VRSVRRELTFVVVVRSVRRESLQLYCSEISEERELTFVL